MYKVNEIRVRAIEVILYVVDSRYLEVQGTLCNTARYPYLHILDLQNWAKNKSNNHISQMNM